MQPYYSYWLSIRRLLFLMLLGAGVWSCTEKVDLYMEGSPVPVVYCLLNPLSDVQYVRIGRSYRGGDNAMVQPPETDSSVWNIPHEVYIEEYHGDTKGNTYRFVPDNTIEKDSGFFQVDNLRLYSSEFKPVPGNFYHLYVYFPGLDKMVSAKTTVHGAPVILDPLPLSIRKVNFEPGQPFTIRWNPGAYTGVYEMIFRVYYRDSTAAGLEFNSADYTSEGIYNLKTDQMLDYGMGGPSFFAAMAKEIPVISGVVRQVVSVEFIMISGGFDLGIHYRSAKETGSNFTNLMDYSNIGNGIGIFASRSLSRVPNLALSGVTLDLLARSEKTRSLGFIDSRGD
jgi:hypothetical protein